MSGRRQEDEVAGHGDVIEVRHLEHRQFLRAAAVTFEDAPRAALGVPQIQQGHAVFAEQSAR